MAYALFNHEQQIGLCFPTEKEVWLHALASGLVHDLPVADEASGQVIPKGYQIRFCPDNEAQNLPPASWQSPAAVA